MERGKFDPSKSSPYDETTYIGRFRHFLDIIDPRTLTSSDEEILKKIEILKTNSGTDEELWAALKLKQSAFNPGTNEIIPRPWRMSAFLPMNIPILFGMLSTTSTAGTILWQVVNASYNSALNYANRSGAESSNSQILQNYLLAVTTAVTLSFSVRRLGSKGKFKVILDKAPFVVPYVAVAGAGAANVYATRRLEMIEGIPITDETGTQLFGTSKEAGKQAVLKTILTRAVGLPIPVLILPPLMMKAVPTSSSPAVKLGIELVVITMCLAGALPATIALYPQRLELNVNSLEERFHNLIDEKTGKRIDTVYANKGL